MISYKPFYETLLKKGITEYNLIFKQGFSANTLHRMKKGEAINTKALDSLCYALDCEVSDILKFEKEQHIGFSYVEVRCVIFINVKKSGIMFVKYLKG